MIESVCSKPRREMPSARQEMPGNCTRRRCSQISVSLYHFGDAQRVEIAERVSVATIAMGITPACRSSAIARRRLSDLHSAARITGNRAYRAPADTEHASSALNRVVRLARRIHPYAAMPPLPLDREPPSRTRAGAAPRCKQIRDRAA